MKSRALLLKALLAAGVLAQQATITGPVAGFLFDQPTRSLRPILGVPGASYLGEPLASELDWAAVSPGGEVALVVRGGAVFAVRGLKNLNPAWTAVEGAIAGVDRIALAVDASAAALYSSASGWLQIVRLDAAPAAAEPVELASLGGRVSALALDRERLLAGIEAEQGGGVYLIESGAAPRLLAPLAQPAAIVLSGRNAYVADRAARRVLEVRDYAGSAATLLVAGEESGITDPIGLAVSRDGGSLFLASRSEKSLDILDLASRSVTARLPLDAAPSQVEPLAGRALFLLNTGGDGSEPYLVLDAGQAPAVYFVPVGRGE